MNDPFVASKITDLAKAIDEIARNLEGAARQLRGISEDVKVNQDVGEATVAAEVLSNLLGNIRLDALVRLPYEVLERRHLLEKGQGNA